MAAHNLPTTQERAGIERFAAWRKRLGLVVLIFPGLISAFAALNLLLPGAGGWPLLVPVVVLVVVELGLVIYVSFFLRCPRCAGWIGPAVSKCASCGLKYELPGKTSKAWHPDMPRAPH